MEIQLIAGVIPLILWGINALFEKKAITDSGVWGPLFYIHVFLVVLGLIPAVIVGDLPNFDLKFFIFITIFGFFDFLGMYLFYKGFSVSKVGIITPISSSYAVIIAIVSAVFFNEPLGLERFLLILLIVFGIILLSVNIKEWKNAKKSDYAGVFYALIVFLIYGIWVPLWDQFISQGGFLYIITADRIVILGFILGISLFKKESLRTRKSSIGLIFLSAVTLAMASTVYNWGLYESDEISLISAISSAYPLVAVLGAYFFLKEKLTTNQYAGIGIIVIGIVLISIFG